MLKVYNKSWIKHYSEIFTLQCFLISTMLYAAKLTPTVPQISNKNGLKYILLWQKSRDFINIFGEGQDAFLQNDCPVDSCFISSDRDLFRDGVEEFDAILFNGWNLSWYNTNDLPAVRHNHQKYAYVQRESAAKTYVCHTGFDNFFNWTITYKLDSDIVYPHIFVKDRNDNIIGPKKNMKWISNLPKVDTSMDIDLESKTKTVAWFDLDCDTANVNRKFVENLQRALLKYDLNIDVYGKCGPFNCSEHHCNEILEKYYYFYLAIEDSFAEDYVTGNVLRALLNNVVPIVYGGANYSRFLPPKSYLDGTSQTPETVAAIMDSLIKNQTLYREYFRWKSHYSFTLGQITPSLPFGWLGYIGPTVCDLCKALHEPNKFSLQSAYSDFRKWWYPNYEQECRKQSVLEQKIVMEKELKEVVNEIIIQKIKEINDEKKITNAVSRRKTKGKKLISSKKDQIPYKEIRRALGTDIVMKYIGIWLWYALWMAASLGGAGLIGAGGPGGGGGAAFRNIAWWTANEFRQIRASVFVNNFDIYKR